jgi:hypothetical protein
MCHVTPHRGIPHAQRQGVRWTNDATPEHRRTDHRHAGRLSRRPPSTPNAPGVSIRRVPSSPALSPPTDRLSDDRPRGHSQFDQRQSTSLGSRWHSRLAQAAAGVQGLRCPRRSRSASPGSASRLSVTGLAEPTGLASSRSVGRKLGAAAEASGARGGLGRRRRRRLRQSHIVAAAAGPRCLQPSANFRQ